MVAMARAALDGIGAPASTKPRGRATTRDHVVVHVDAERLVGSETAAGTRCEIPGLGPVPVEHARTMLGEAILSILVEHGRDVRTFARPGRNVTAALAQLLTARDAIGSITGCERSARLEGDHARPVGAGGDSTTDNVRGMCRHHHRKKTDGWILVDHPDGRRTLEPPDERRRPAAA